MRESFPEIHTSNGVVLGLPRKISHQRLHYRSKHVTQDRHSSPVHYHIARQQDGYVVRVSLFPAVELPNLTESGDFLLKLAEHLARDLPERCNERQALAAGTSGSPPGSIVTRAATTASSGSRAEKVTVQVQERHALGIFVKEEGKPRSLLKFDRGTPPAVLPQPGDMIQVYRSNNSPRSPEYRWDEPPPHRRNGGPRRGR